MKTNKLFLACVALFLAPLFAVLALAQTNGVDILPGDQKIADVFSKLSAWQFLLAPVVGMLVQGIKTVFEKIPPKWLTVIAPLLGAILDYAASKAGFWTGNAAVGAAMGGLAVWGHQFLTQPITNKTTGNP